MRPFPWRLHVLVALGGGLVVGLYEGAVYRPLAGWMGLPFAAVYLGLQGLMQWRNWNP
jgi:hypothetical protein